MHLESQYMLFSEVEVAAYTELLDTPRGLSFHKGGPIWPNWDSQLGVRHCAGGVPIDDRPEPLGKTEPDQRTTQPLAWCGPISEHFGHQIADFSTRILNYKHVGDVYYAFGAPPGKRVTSVAETPNFFREILHWFDVPTERVKILSECAIARELVCAPQQEQRGGGGIPPSEKYLDALDTNLENKGLSHAKRGTYYVSRAGMHARLAGEGYLEFLLGQNGVKIVRPESISLLEQLRIYYSADKLIFSEGSALHGLQLLGRGIGDVFVLNRRSKSALARKLLFPRARSLSYFDVGDLVHGLTVAGQPAYAVGLTVLKKERVLSTLDNIGIRVLGWSDRLFREFIKADIDAWLRIESRSRRATVEGSLDLIFEQLDALGCKPTILPMRQ